MNQAVLRRRPQARVRANRIGARLLLDLARKTGHVLTADSVGVQCEPLPQGDRDRPRLDGALIGFPPERMAAPPPSFHQIGLLLRQGLGATLRWGAVQTALAAIRPIEPHWTLAMVGVEPSRQGSGIGGALVARWIAGLAGSPAPAWVETDRPELAAFYGRFGFELSARCEVYGVEVLGLRRPSACRTPRSGG